MSAFESANQPPEPFNVERRALNAFLVSMPWHTFVDFFNDRIALRNLVSIPDRNEAYVDQIASLVKDYFATNMSKVSTQSYLFRRKIMSINGLVSLNRLLTLITLVLTFLPIEQRPP